MKRLLLIVLTILTCISCGRNKVTDPAQRRELRTRDITCPIDSVLSPKAVKTTFNITGTVKPEAFINDYKESYAACTAEKPADKIKEAYKSVKEKHSADYNPGLTIYSVMMLLVFVILMLVKILRAIFRNV